MRGLSAQVAAQATDGYVPAPAILAGLAALAELGKRAAADPQVAAASGEAPGDFPDLDPMMALGSSTPLFTTLGHWQRLDLPVALREALPPSADGDAERRRCRSTWSRIFAPR